MTIKIKRHGRLLMAVTGVSCLIGALAGCAGSGLQLENVSTGPVLNTPPAGVAANATNSSPSASPKAGRVEGGSAAPEGAAEAGATPTTATPPATAGRSGPTMIVKFRNPSVILYEGADTNMGRRVPVNSLEVPIRLAAEDIGRFRVRMQTVDGIAWVATEDIELK